jgi:hypothetical protein
LPLILELKDAGTTSLDSCLELLLLVSLAEATTRPTVFDLLPTHDAQDEAGTADAAPAADRADRECVVDAVDDGTPRTAAVGAAADANELAPALAVKLEVATLLVGKHASNS